jgi:hypothetical protein
MHHHPSKNFRKAMAQAKQIRYGGATKSKVTAWVRTVKRALTTEDSDSAS